MKIPFILSLLLTCSAVSDAQVATYQPQISRLSQTFEEPCSTGLNPVRNPGGFGLTASAYERWWPNGSILNVVFLNGSASDHSLLRNAANEWARHANLQFRFHTQLPTGQRDIAIRFGTSGNNSFLGVDSRKYARSGQTTMNIQDRTSRVALHEFGHALGLTHEHLSPRANIPWNRDAVYSYYQGPPNNWSREKIDYNIFEVQHTTPLATQFDSQSIMLYPVLNRFTHGNYEITYNTSLSRIDRFWIAALYPRGETWLYRNLVDNSMGRFVKSNGRWTEYIFRDGVITNFSETQRRGSEIHLRDNLRSIDLILRANDGLLKGPNNPQFVKYYKRIRQ